MPSIHVNSPEEYAQYVSASNPKLVVVDFTATWCGPCNMIAPVFEKLSEQYKDANFLKVDVDKQQAISRAAGVTAMPTFHFFKQGNKVAEMRGANPQKLEELIKKHYASSGQPQESGNDFGLKGFIDLSPFVLAPQVECLNLKSGSPKAIFNQKNVTVIESDCDEQLIIALQFTQAVKLHSIKFAVPESVENAPKTVKLYVNRMHLGFDEADSIEPTQTLELTAADYEKNAVTNLKFVKYQNVTSLCVFIQDNLTDADTTKLGQMIFLGVPTEQTNLANLKKEEQE